MNSRTHYREAAVSTSLTFVSRLLVTGILFYPFVMLFSLCESYHSHDKTNAATSSLPIETMQVQVNVSASRADCQEVEGYFNQCGYGPAVTLRSGPYTFVRTRHLTDIKEFAPARERIRERFAEAVVVDSRPPPHVLLAEVRNLSATLQTGTDGDAISSEAARLLLRLKEYLKAVNARERLQFPEEPVFDWDTQTHWDPVKLQLTIAGSVCLVRMLPSFADANDDEFLCRSGY